MSAATEFLQYLGEEAQTNAQLQEVSGLTQPNVNNRLTALKGLGLVKRVGNGWVKVVKSNGSEAPVNDSAIPPPQGQTQEGAQQAGKCSLAAARGGCDVQLLP